MEDHDQRFKHMLREFFREFMELFFARWAAQLDFTAVEWLDKELFADPPQGEKRFLDLVAKAPVKGAGEPEEQIILIHVEVESKDQTTALDERFPDYVWHLRRKYGLKVLPLALFLRVGLEGLGERVCEETVLGEWVSRLRYWYVGLPALEAETYLNGANSLGFALAALMKARVGERAKLTAEAQDQLVKCSESAARKFLLIECLQAYAPLTDAEKIELTSLLQTPRYQGVQAMNKTVYEEGMEKGMEKGVEKGMEKGMKKERRRAIERTLLRKFKTLSDAARQRLANYPEEKLDDLFDAAFDAASLKDLGLED
jgi:hypothetical protein